MQVLTASGKSALEKVAGKDPSRPILTGVHLKLDDPQDADEKGITGWLAATDSYKLALIPVAFDKAEKPIEGVYPAEAFKAIKPYSQVLFTPDKGKTIGGITVTTDDKRAEWKRIDGQFPNYSMLFPDAGGLVGPDFTLSFNAKLLYELAQGLGSDHVILQAVECSDGTPNPLRPIVVRAGKGSNDVGYSVDEGPLGIIMPIRVAA